MIVNNTYIHTSYITSAFFSLCEVRVEGKIVADDADDEERKNHTVQCTI